VITDEKAPRGEFKPLLNGKVADVSGYKVFDAYPGSVYLDQDELYKVLYCGKRVIPRVSSRALQLIIDGRVWLYPDFPKLTAEIQKGGFNFSFGARAHGNIAALITGIPAVMQPVDSRTREIAEFFEVPYVSNFNPLHDLYQLYADTSYEKFNATFRIRFQQFAEFVDRHRLPFTLGRNESFDNSIALVEYSAPSNLSRRDRIVLSAAKKVAPSYQVIHRITSGHRIRSKLRYCTVALKGKVLRQF